MDHHTGDVLPDSILLVVKKDFHAICSVFGNVEERILEVFCEDSLSSPCKPTLICGARWIAGKQEQHRK
jgi:hypothetical protein